MAGEGKEERRHMFKQQLSTKQVSQEHHDKKELKSKERERKHRRSEG